MWFNAKGNKMFLSSYQIFDTQQGFFPKSLMLKPAVGCKISSSSSSSSSYSSSSSPSPSVQHVDADWTAPVFPLLSAFHEVMLLVISMHTSKNCSHQFPWQQEVFLVWI